MFHRAAKLTKKPDAGIRINYDHYLAKYLAACYIPTSADGTKLRDLSIYANHGTKTGTTSPIGAYGRELGLNGSSDLVTVSYGRQLDPSTIFPSASRGVIILARVKSTGGAGSPQTICCRNYDGISNIPYFLGIGGGNATNGMGQYNNTFYSTGVTTDIRGDGKYHVVCGVLANSSDGSNRHASFYIDGKRDATAAVGQTVAGSGTLGLKIGADYNGANFFNGVIESLQLLIGVPLPAFTNGPTPLIHMDYIDKLVANLSADPYQMIAMPSQAYSYGVASANNGNFFFGMVGGS